MAISLLKKILKFFSSFQNIPAVSLRPSGTPNGAKWKKGGGESVRAKMVSARRRTTVQRRTGEAKKATYIHTHSDKEGGQMVRRDGATREKQQLARVFTVCQSGLNMACFWHFFPSRTHSPFLMTLSAQNRKKKKWIYIFSSSTLSKCRVKSKLFTCFSWRRNTNSPPSRFPNATVAVWHLKNDQW